MKNYDFPIKSSLQFFYYLLNFPPQHNSRLQAEPIRKNLDENEYVYSVLWFIVDENNKREKL